LKSKKSIPTSILHLLFTFSPTAITRLVIAVVVFPLDRPFSAWTWSYIGQEIQERFSPAITHCNSTTAVVSVLAVIGITASLNNTLPDSVFGCGIEIHAMSMRATDGSDFSALSTPATCGASVLELIRPHSANVAAVAATVPKITNLFCIPILSGKSKHSQLRKRLVADVNKSLPGWQRRKDEFCRVHGIDIVSIANTDIKG
jgi:hypothetical protein